MCCMSGIPDCHTAAWTDIFQSHSGWHVQKRAGSWCHPGIPFGMSGQTPGQYHRWQYNTVLPLSSGARSVLRKHLSEKNRVFRVLQNHLPPAVLPERNYYPALKWIQLSYHSELFHWPQTVPESRSQAAVLPPGFLINIVYS